MLLLGKMDTRRLKEKSENKNDYYANECEHCAMLMKFQWKLRGTYENKPKGGWMYYHAACATRHLETYYNEAGRDSIKERLIEKSAI